MGWLNNIINKAKKKTEETVQGAVQQGQQAINSAIQQSTPVVQNAVQQGQQATPVVQNAVQQSQQAVNSAIQQGQQIVQNTVQNVSQGVTDKVNDINNQIQGNVPGAQVQQPQTSPTVPEHAQTNTTTNTPTQGDSSFTVDEPILTYEDYLNKESEGLGYIKDQTTQHIDQQNTETLKHIDEKLTSSTEYATDVKETTDKSLQEQKDDVYKYAEETLAGALGYNQEAYGKLVEAITGQMEAGKLAASKAKNLLMIMAEEAKNTTYGAAERQRTEAERQADINRQRAIADANSAYEQNKAEYGAKAEALGNMGLSGGGYGDWLNASAYAQNRSEVQGARAQSDAAKREARYTEDMTKLQADQEYNNKKYQAESDYLNKMHEIDTSYRTNMSEAEQSKLAADKAAYDTERDTKQKADSNYAAGNLQSDIEYKGFLYESEQEAKDQKLQANQDAANKKLQAEISYVEGILGNSKALAEYKESLKAGDAAAEEKKLAVYEQLLKGVNDGTYTAEDAAALADAFGLGKEWKDAIANSAGNKAEADANAKAESEQMQNRQDYTSVLVGVANGELDEATATALAKEYGFSKEQTDAIIKAAQGRASGETGDMFIDTLINASNGKLDEATATAIAKQYGFNEEQKNAVVKAVQGAADKVQKEQKTQNFNTLLDRAKTGTLTKDEVMQMASELGFDANNPDDKKLLDLIGSAADRYANATEEEKKYQKNMNVLTLLDGAKTGAYGVDEIDNIASMLGLDPKKDESLLNMIKTAAGDYADGVTKSEEQQKMNTFINLLGSANAGELTADELSQIASELGLSDEQKTLLTTAAGRYQTGSEEEKSAQKTMNFISLLDGANTGAYNSEQIAQMAEMLGLDPKNEADAKLIGMLKTAADDFAAGEAGKTAKEDMQYQNGVYAELLAAANSGDLTEEQIRDIAGRFGFKGDDLYNLTKAAKDVATKKAVEELEMEKGLSAENKSNILKEMANGDLGTDITDADIDKWVKEEILTPEDAEDLKVKRNEMIIEELEYYAQNGYTTEAVDKVEELVEKGIISKDDDVYQKTYFDVGLHDAQNIVNTGSATAADITKYEKTLKKQLEEGKLSEADYNSLVDYFYKSAGKVVNKNSYTFKRSNSAESSGPFEYLDVTINGKEYKGVWVFSEKKADETLSNVLDKMANNGEMLVMFNGELYAKTYIYGWCPVNNEDLKKDYSTVAESTPKTTKPKHKVVKSTPTKNETDDDGIRGGSKAGGIAGGDVVNALK